MKIYISGKITGLDMQTARNYFDIVAEKLRSVGHTPVNPFEIVPFDPDHTWEHYMVEDIRALLSCEAILMLENWTDSKGAKIEHAIAEKLGIKIYYQQNHNFF